MFSFFSKAFSTVKTYAIAILAVAVGLLAAVASWYRASLKSAQLKGEKKARKTEQKATEAMIDGLENESKPVSHSDKRDDFK